MRLCDQFPEKTFAEPKKLIEQTVPEGSRDGEMSGNLYGTEIVMRVPAPEAD
jgi:hypothetical protein